MSTDNMHPIVREFFNTARECGIDIACAEVDLEKLEHVDPVLYDLVCEYLDLEMDFFNFFQEEYGEDLYDEVDPESIYSEPDDDDEGEEWKQK